MGSALYQSIRRKRRRELLIELFGGRCKYCSSTEGLEFDHIDSKSRIFRIATHMSVAIEKLLPELAKCQLLCKSCHNKKTASERLGRIFIAHGTANTYNNKKCRCDLCRAAWAKYHGPITKRYRLQKSLERSRLKK